MYTVDTDGLAQQHVNVLPPEALAAFAELRGRLGAAPWSGQPYHQNKPQSAMRARAFGAHGEGLVTYLILDDQRRVDVLTVQWVGRPTSAAASCLPTSSAAPAGETVVAGCAGHQPTAVPTGAMNWKLPLPTERVKVRVTATALS